MSEARRAWARPRPIGRPGTLARSIRRRSGTIAGSPATRSAPGQRSLIPRTTVSRAIAALAVAAVAGLAGCASLVSSVPRLPPPPVLDARPPLVVDAPAIRYYPHDSAELRRDLEETYQRERAMRGVPNDAVLPEASFLALSGGGQNGAFGAGLLVGWTEHGDRPEFRIVTGVSTGALIAPFAFLGPAWNKTLTRLYTEVSSKDIVEERNISAALFDDALADNLPLQKLVEANVTDEVLEALARESLRGRTLLVATTDLDTRRTVFWNLTLMAEVRTPRTLDLVRRILVASAAIPGELPPAMIDVEVDGKRYQEMHVDGGTTTQVFLLPRDILLSDLAARSRTVYVIRNGHLHIRPREVPRSALEIVKQAIASLIHTQAIGNLYQIALRAEHDGSALRIAFIPDAFTLEERDDFDRDYMNELFLLGYTMARRGFPWLTAPP